MANKNASDSGDRRRVVVIAGGMVAVLGGVFATMVATHKPAVETAPAPATAEAKAYVKFLKISAPELKEVSSYMSLAKVYEITGNLTNTGDRVVNSADLNCVFYDPYGQVVLRQRVALIKARDGGLKPGATKPIRLPFESLPDSWNRGMPGISIAQIEFGQ